MREAQIEPDDRLIFTAGDTIEDGEKAALQLLNESVSMTAIQAANDLVAIGAANVFLNQGDENSRRTSPSRGFGNVVMSEHFRVPLTTVRQPKLRLGAAALEIMQKLAPGRTPESRRLATEIVVRASTGCRSVQVFPLICQKPIPNHRQWSCPSMASWICTLLNPREIGDLLSAYLDECRQRGILEVRIIHGKGVGNLQRTVHALLSRRRDVVRFSFASAAYGGGAPPW